MTKSLNLSIPIYLIVDTTVENNPEIIHMAYSLIDARYYAKNLVWNPSRINFKIFKAFIPAQEISDDDDGDCID
jgi:hypothetical protein